MKVYIKELIDMHQLALNLTYAESSILYDIFIDCTNDFQEIDENTNDIYINEKIFSEIYSTIMFKFMTVLINLK
ncbi:hypothetical protein [Clostridium disporicum]|uniref:hypothetical protein n=1 Tax=Clostridium disporicum TaxID=84024 RepID=UPI00360F0846